MPTLCAPPPPSPLLCSVPYSLSLPSYLLFTTYGGVRFSAVNNKSWYPVVHNFWCCPLAFCAQITCTMGYPLVCRAQLLLLWVLDRWFRPGWRDGRALPGRILFVSVGFYGHAMPLLSLAEEMAERQGQATTCNISNALRG